MLINLTTTTSRSSWSVSMRTTSQYSKRILAPTLTRMRLIMSNTKVGQIWLASNQGKKGLIKIQTLTISLIWVRWGTWPMNLITNLYWTRAILPSSGCFKSSSTKWLTTNQGSLTPKINNSWWKLACSPNSKCRCLHNSWGHRINRMSLDNRAKILRNSFRREILTKWWHSQDL